MSKNKELLHKPNQTIMITNGEITVSQRKTYNVILHDARKQLKENPNKILFYFSIADLKDRAGIHATNNKELKKNLDKLRFIGVETIHENGDWCAFNLLAQVEKKGDGLEIQMPEKIRQALIDNSYYTTLDLLIMKNLQGKYAVILYEFAMRYHKKQLPELSLEEFKELTGTTETKSYSNINNLKTYVIEPAIEEINEKTDIRLSYKEIKTGTKTTSLKFKVVLNKSIKNTEEIEIIEEQKEYSGAVRELFELLPEKEQIENRKNELEKLLKEHSVEMLKADIEYTKNKAKTDFWAYFLKSIKSGHYSSAELEKKKIAEEKNRLRAELEEIEKKEQEKMNEEKEKIAIEKYKKMTTEEIEKYQKEFNKLAENIKKIAFQNSFEVFVISKLKME